MVFLLSCRHICPSSPRFVDDHATFLSNSDLAKNDAVLKECRNPSVGIDDVLSAGLPMFEVEGLEVTPSDSVVFGVLLLGELAGVNRWVKGGGVALDKRLRGRLTCLVGTGRRDLGFGLRLRLGMAPGVLRGA